MGSSDIYVLLGGNPVRLASSPGQVQCSSTSMCASCYGNREKVRPFGPLVHVHLYLTFIVTDSAVCLTQYNNIVLHYFLQSMYNAGQWEPRLWPWAQPDLNYAAPEYILSRSCDVSSDMFSLGVLIHSIYNKGRPLFDCDNNMTAFKRNVEQVRTHPRFLGTLPNFC